MENELSLNVKSAQFVPFNRFQINHNIINISLFHRLSPNDAGTICVDVDISKLKTIF